MRAALICGLVACSGLASGQLVMDPSRVPPAFKDFRPPPPEKKLKCEITPIQPRLNFSFRFQTGYVVSVPLNQYFGKGHMWAVLIRVTPKEGDRKPVFLTTATRLPEIPKTKYKGQASGGFLVGEGNYRVDWMMIDDIGRICVKSWDVEAKFGRAERRAKPGLPPNTITSLAGRRWSSSTLGDDSSDRRPLRLTVLMHAATASSRRSRLQGFDRVMQMGMLASLLEQMRLRSVRLVLFNLDQQRELLRQDDFKPEQMSQVAQALSGLQLGLVDYSVLQNRSGHVNLLADLINRELRAADRSDMVVFLGPPTRHLDRFPTSALGEDRSSAPLFFYLQYLPYFGRGGEFPDLLQHATRELKGKTSKIRTPGDFAKAIEQMSEAGSGGN